METGRITRSHKSRRNDTTAVIASSIAMQSSISFSRVSILQGCRIDREKLRVVAEELRANRDTEFIAIGGCDVGRGGGGGVGGGGVSGDRRISGGR